MVHKIIHQHAAELLDKLELLQTCPVLGMFKLCPVHGIFTNFVQEEGNDLVHFLFSFIFQINILNYTKKK